MTRPEIQVCLANKVEAAWTAYHQKVLRLPSSRVYAMAHEIHATRTCYEELVYNAGEYPVDLLERLLALDDPLETVREQWIRKENEELSQRLGCVLRSIWEPEQESAHGVVIQRRDPQQTVTVQEADAPCEEARADHGPEMAM